MTDEGFDQRCTLLSHLSYVPGDSSGDGGTRTHNPRITNHVLQSAVGHVSVATKVLVRGVSVRESNPPTARRSPDSLDGADVLRTGSRRLYSKAQRRIIEIRLFGGPGTQPGCSPDRQLGSVLRPSNEGWARTLDFLTGRCSLNRQLDSQRRRWESNPLRPGCSRLPCRLAPASFSVPARNRTWSTSFAGSRAIRHTPGTCCVSVARRGIEPRLADPKSAVRSSTLAGHVVSIPTWT